MTKLAKYLKPFVGFLIFAVVMLFVQAMCDLNLPNYMSNIVNVGIQQSGIESSAPDALSEQALAFISTFMDEEEREIVADNYTRHEAGDSELTDRYPGAAETAVYLRTGEDERLEEIFGRAALSCVNLLRGDEFAAQLPEEASANAGETGVDAQMMYQAAPLLQALPDQAFVSAREGAASADEMLWSQTGIAFVQGYYSELQVDMDALRMSYILRTGLLMLLITLLGVFAAIAVGFCASRSAAGFARDLRRDVFRKVEEFGNGEFDRYSTSSLITRTTNDITQTQMLLVLGVRILFYAPIMAVGGIVMVVGKGGQMTWIIGLSCAVLFVLIGVIFKIAMPKFKLMQKLIDRLNLVSRENLTGIMVVRAFGNQEFEEKRFDKANRDLTGTSLFVNRVMVFMMPAMMLIMNLTTLLIVWVGADQIQNATMQVGDIMAFIQYAMQIIMSFLMISMMFIMVPRASVSAERIAEVLATEPDVVSPAQPKPFCPEKRGVVEFENVSFRYANAEEDVLHEISFRAEPGKTTAFIGSTGSGKSTLINLIPRFYDVTKGRVKVDGVDVRECDLEGLRKSIGYVPQKGVLLSGTIASNLRYGKPDATEEELMRAVRIAQAEEIIAEKEEGLESPIAQGGGNVSGGQKQRLSIARALVRHPEIYIFDDSFSALDFKTDAALRRALKNETGDATVLIVAQRINTILDADQIVVLDEGKVVGIGTHRELLSSCPTYYEIASSQLSKEELA